MRLGAHLSIKDGFDGALKKAVELGCDGFQIFVGNPRGWTRKPIADSEYHNFIAKRAETDIWPVVVHLCYLPNPASEDEELYRKSVLTLAEDFRRANRLGADFFVFHPGKAKGTSSEKAIERVSAAVNLVLEEVSGPTVLLFENQAGAGTEIAANLETLGELIRQMKEPERVGVCWDTCHAFAAGYDMATEAGCASVFEAFDQSIGLEYLKLFHLNDCMGKLGSGLDRHQHIGAGEIGLAGFTWLLNHATLSRVPGILETPQNDEGDDLRNLATLRGLIQKG